ncbi:hypothetical protein KIW84_063265 [Lathyrus oleraceus]|uniref:Uncharacterized protein n=1 Tax=Pisum sativum TaxID=3888 RepID=A0A9D4W9C8_PEA|nr:hypothetical protein KIW84_063265 [Pisum sativum]
MFREAATVVTVCGTAAVPFPKIVRKCIRIEMHWLPFVMESKGEMSENAAVTGYPNSSNRLLTENAAVTDYPTGSNQLHREDLQQPFFEFSDPEAYDTVVPTPTVAQNDVVNNGRPVRQRALPHRLRDYERFQDNEVNNDGDFVHFALMAESEPSKALLEETDCRSIEGTRLALVTPHDKPSEITFMKYKNLFLEIKTFVSTMTLFADRCFGPSWFRNRFLDVTPSAAAMSNSVWATYLTSTLLSTRIETGTVGFAFIGYHPNLVA